MKIAAKLSIIFALLSMISIGVIGYSTYRNGRKLIIADKYEDLVAASDYTQAAFERWVAERVKTIEITVKSPFFQNDFSKLMSVHDIKDPVHMTVHRAMVEERLKPIVGSGNFKELFILRPEDGTITFSTDKAQEEKRVFNQPFFRNGKRGSYIQNVYYSMSLQQAAVTVSTPIKDTKGKLVAVLAGHLNLAELSAIMEKGRQFRQTTDTYLVNKFNFFVTEPRFGKNYALKKAIQTQGVNAALSQKTGIDLYTDYRKVPVIGAYRWLPDWQMCLISEIDQSEAFAPIYRLQKKVFTISGFVAVFAAIAGWLIALTISRPLKRLIEDTKAISKGNLGISFRSGGKDEIGDLSRAFQQMTKSLDETLVSRDALIDEVSERKKAESELRESELKFRTLSDASPVGIFIVRQSDLKLAYANPAVSNIFGYSESELIGKRGPMELTHPDDHETTRQYLKRVVAGEDPGLLTFTGRAHNGGDLLCEAMVRTAELDGEQMFMGTLVDATERIRAKEQVKREQNFSDMVINSLPGVFYLFDEKDLRFQRWNQNFEMVTGYSSSEITKMSPLDLFDEQEGSRVAKRIGEVFEKGYATVEADFLTKNGDRIPYLFNGHALKTDDVNYLIGMGIDLTERKHAERALQESEDRFRRLAENAKDMIYRMSLPDGKYEYVSPASRDIFGYAPKVFYDRPFLIRKAIHEEWKDYFAEQWENLLKGNMPPTYEYQIVDASGQIKWLNQRNVLIRDDKDHPKAIEGIVTDVTDIKRATLEQIRLEKFVVLGQMVAGVAHELNNPLMGVLNYSQYCLGDLSEEDERHQILKDIEHETKRCIGIVQNLLGASRLEDPNTLKIEAFSPENILTRIVRLMDYRSSKEGVTVSLDLDKNLPEIQMNSEAFQQLCLNLFTNAVDAVEMVALKEINFKLQRKKNDIVLSVSDTGTGISDDIKNKIFDPFFTTKDPGKGTGLGLATCWKIVHQYGGTIQCQNKPEPGATMTVKLPLYPKSKMEKIR